MFSYLEFENTFRGSREFVKNEQRVYVELFEGLAPILDAGCGRGEFLELLKEKGVESYGVDLDKDMLNLCREKKLDVKKDDIFQHLENIKPESLGGIFASHIVEHFEPQNLFKFVELSYRAIKKGGIIIVETLNPSCLLSYPVFYMDVTHRFPVHPETLKFYFTKQGFIEPNFSYTEYLPSDYLKLKEITTTKCNMTVVEESCKENFRRLSYIMDMVFSKFIYALKAKKP